LTVTTRVRRAGWSLVAAALPIAASVAVLLTEVDRARPFALSQPMVRRVMSDTLVLESLIVVLVAPLAGVGVVRRRLQSSGPVGALGRAWDSVSPLALAIGVFVVVSAFVAASAFGFAADAARVIVVSHLTLGAAALALGALGAFCALVFRDVLDAAACSASIAIVSACGVIVAGAPIRDLPTPLLNAALLASPVVATASAANIDIFRSELLYQISPVAHRLFEYPAWYTASALYVLVATLVFGGMVIKVRLANTTPT
jgi:hypothetical protein